MDIGARQNLSVITRDKKLLAPYFPRASEAAVIEISYGDEFEVRQFFMRDLDEEPALLAGLDALFRQFDGFVTYNGAGFEPWVDKLLKDVPGRGAPVIVDATKPLDRPFSPVSKCPDEAMERIKLEDYVPGEVFQHIPMDRTTYWA